MSDVVSRRIILQELDAAFNSVSIRDSLANKVIPTEELRKLYVTIIKYREDVPELEDSIDTISLFWQFYLHVWKDFNQSLPKVLKSVRSIFPEKQELTDTWKKMVQRKNIPIIFYRDVLKEMPFATRVNRFPFTNEMKYLIGRYEELFVVFSSFLDKAFSYIRELVSDEGETEYRSGFNDFLLSREGEDDFKKPIIFVRVTRGDIPIGEVTREGVFIYPYVEIWKFGQNESTERGLDIDFRNLAHYASTGELLEHVFDEIPDEYQHFLDSYIAIVYSKKERVYRLLALDAESADIFSSKLTQSFSKELLDSDGDWVIPQGDVAALAKISSTSYKNTATHILDKDSIVLYFGGVPEVVENCG